MNKINITSFHIKLNIIIENVSLVLFKNKFLYFFNTKTTY